MSNARVIPFPCKRSHEPDVDTVLIERLRSALERAFCTGRIDLVKDLTRVILAELRAG